MAIDGSVDSSVVSAPRDGTAVPSSAPFIVSKKVECVPTR
jgi:hypothetical protein